MLDPSSECEFIYGFVVCSAVVAVLLSVWWQPRFMSLVNHNKKRSKTICSVVQKWAMTYNLNKQEPGDYMVWIAEQLKLLLWNLKLYEKFDILPYLTHVNIDGINLSSLNFNYANEWCNNFMKSPQNFVFASRNVKIQNDFINIHGVFRACNQFFKLMQMLVAKTIFFHEKLCRCEEFYIEVEA